MSIYLDQAQRILANIDIDAPEVAQAREELSTFNKTSGVGDLINNPKFQNAVNLLTPFVVNYKVNQVLKLLKELEKDKNKDLGNVPGTSFKRYFK